MDVNAVTLFFSLLALLANVLVIALVSARIWAGKDPERKNRLAGPLSPLSVPVAAVVATTCMLGSLYLSEVAHFPPCHLCWAQRFAMYPLAAILVLAAILRDRNVRPYATLLAVLGLPLSLFHIAVERFPNLGSSSCDPKNPCSIMWVQKFSFVTIPYMAASGFLLILAALWLIPAPSTTPDSDAAGIDTTTEELS
jgi:disulfide bond formation protein DsbB